MKIVQVVPWLPPVVEGVGGYAATLARELRASAGIATRFVVAGSRLAWEGPLPDPTDPTDPDTRRLPPGPDTRAALAEAFEGSGAPTLLLHYVNYAYHPRGCPRDLVAAVLGWRERARGRRLVTLFHEVYASGPPWRSSFWLGPVQRRLAAALARASDGVLTSLALYRDLLAPWVPPERVTLAPVFSTVGEPAAVPGLAEREPRRIVVFGGAGVRARAYEAGRDALAAACRDLGAVEILDVGPARSGLPAAVGGVPVRALGLLPAEGVSGILLGAFAGFLAYPPAFLGKSTIFAAYCAHGLLPICPKAAFPPGGERCLQATADAARAWYLEHSLPRQAAVFARLLTG